MSRSYKKPVLKIKGFYKDIYHRIIRRVSKQYLNNGKDIPNPKTIMLDYDYTDYISDGRFDDDEWTIKAKRK